MLGLEIAVCYQNVRVAQRRSLGHQHRRILGLRDELHEEIVAAGKLARNCIFETCESSAVSDYGIGYRRKTVLFINLGSNRSECHASLSPRTR